MASKMLKLDTIEVSEALFDQLVDLLANREPSACALTSAAGDREEQILIGRGRIGLFPAYVADSEDEEDYGDMELDEETLAAIIPTSQHQIAPARSLTEAPQESLPSQAIGQNSLLQSVSAACGLMGSKSDMQRPRKRLPPVNFDEFGNHVPEEESPEAPAPKRRRLVQKGPVSASRIEEEEEEEEEDEEEEDEKAREKRAIDEWWMENDAKGSISPKEREEMMANAKTIAGPESVEEWRIIFPTWRRDATMYPSIENALLDTLGTTEEDFLRAWKAVENAEGQMAFQQYICRWRYVDLGRMFAAVDIPNLRCAKGIRAKDARLDHLFRQAYREIGELPRPLSPDLELEYTRFRQKVRVAGKWQGLIDAFGEGILGLVPASVSSRWVARASNSKFRLWIQMIQRFNPQGVQAALHFHNILHAALTGSGPPPQRHAIEEDHAIETDPNGLGSERVRLTSVQLFLGEGVPTTRQIAEDIIEGTGNEQWHKPASEWFEQAYEMGFPADGDQDMWAPFYNNVPVREGWWYEDSTNSTNSQDSQGSIE